MNDEELLKKLRKTFRSEANERIANMSSSLMELEKTSAPDKQKSILEVVFREAHSLKGAARAVNLPEIETLCQSIEGVFAALKREEITCSANLFDTLHDSIGAMENFLAASESEQTDAHKERISSLIRQLGELREGETETVIEERKSKDDQGKHVRIRAMTEDGGQRTEDGGQKKIHETEEEIKENVQSVESERALPEIRNTQKPQRTQQTQSRPLISETIRISTSKLDSLLLKAEELVSLKLVSSEHLSHLCDAAHSFDHWKKRWAKITPEFRVLRKQAQSEDALSRLLEFLHWNQDHIQSLGQDITALKKAAEQDRRTLGNMVDELLEDMKKATMLHFSTLFEILPRMVRDISRDQGKEVDLELQGGEIEIDRRILEEMKDTLIHLLRNAVDHGLEKPEKRLESQKPGRGTINLSVSQAEGSMVQILLSDDGRGIDLMSVKEKAIKLRAISERDAAQLTDREALSLIFRSEISTSPIITEISGRGIGLAIVQENIEKLGGSLSVESNPGKGSSFKIQLPVTLATFRGILVRVSDSLFIVPSSHMERVLRIKKDTIKTVENSATISLNGQVLSLVVLADILGLTRESVADNDREKESEAHVAAMVLGTGEDRIAFEVDEVLGEQEVLVKTLGKQLSKVPNIAGATILGTGKVVPILSARDLLKSSSSATISASEGRLTEDEEKKGRPSSSSKAILVVEDSITSRILLKNILESAGYYVKTAINGQDAYTILKTEEFDGVVSDVEMPKMDGFELTARIRSDTELAEIPVVLVTTLDSREDREKGIDVGANAYIVKRSFDQSNLLETLQRFL